ncbi:prolyl oligopeptidase family serine peptidase [Swaminathania salitolerans]|uniref:Putative peptidase y4nA n=1 Tax=Swaminathania salitolerans TaxID=182838 RepID=A0A511BQ62_9PROT|nr:prolyl oligopeptidase family serine peptidase [Swaminathania salitolerans]GEL02212.1 putative peptidase y4nA [Swaminathania salitolerans]
MRRILPVMTALFCALPTASLASSGPSSSPSSQDTPSSRAGAAPPREALEQVDGARALAWVRQENKRSADLLTADPRYERLYRDVLAVEQSPGRLPLPDQMGGRIWNLWQDAPHPKGLWRVTDRNSFATPHPAWQVMLDIDALARKEKKDWVFQQAECLPPEASRCLVGLSVSGEDAVTYREFDPASKTFVDDGFILPRSKQRVVWVDRDTLLVARDWGAGSMTQSGYPLSVRLVRRGTRLEDAKEIYRGQKGDMIVAPEMLRDETGRQLVLIQRNLDFFRSEYRVYDPAAGTLRQIALPEKIGYLGFYAGKLIVRLDQDWNVGGHFSRGSIVAVDPAASGAAPALVFKPEAGETTTDIGVTSKGIIAVVYRDVHPSVRLYTPSVKESGWQEKYYVLPRMSSATLQSSSASVSYAYLKVEGYIIPPELWSFDTDTGKSRKVKTTPALFDARGLTTEQFWATSSDGVRIPYFVTHRRDWKKNDRNPTLFTAYGGFDLSYLPTYYADIGKTWLERGGVYVVGNIRGGGEFGPAWHEAGMKSGRQHAYDDFAAIARDLAARHIADRDHLGIRGRSNGGLLMGVEFTQHPELWRAVIIGVPLLDMENFETMAAGASWAAEYGHMAIPAERAFLRRISPLQNLKEGVSYPVPFIFTSTRDDRVGPVHARLFAARLEALGKPFFYYEDTEGGHAGTVNAREIAYERALEAVYLSRSLMDQDPSFRH